MHAKTALAVAGSVLAVPSAALAAAADDEATTADRDALHPSGKLTHDAELKDRLVRTNLRLSRRLDRRSDLRRLRALPVSVLRDRNQRLRKRVGRVAPTASAPLQAIAACESGGNPSANTGNGFYGKYQFTQETWQSVGGTGNPAAASEAEQDRRAAALYAQQGASPWSVCGR
jgi:transglycosylase-like protein